MGGGVFSLGTGDKIAIIGSAPSSIRLAPFADETWNIWGCSPGAFGICPRSDVWFELHRWEPPTPGYPNEPSVPWFSPEYAEFLKQHKGTIFTSVPVDEIPNHAVYPFDEMSAKYGDYHWTSSVAWMIAMAIEQNPKAIGLWGVDMAANEEYHAQRPACQHFLGIAMSQGIEVILPPESDLMRPPPPYGFIEYNPRFIKMLARQRELTARLANSNTLVQQESAQIQFLNGALDDLNYMINTFSYEGSNDLRFAISNARAAAQPNLSVHGKAIEIGDGEIPPQSNMSDAELHEITERAKKIIGEDVPEICPDCGGSGEVISHNPGGGVDHFDCPACRHNKPLMDMTDAEFIDKVEATAAAAEETQPEAVCERCHGAGVVETGSDTNAPCPACCEIKRDLSGTVRPSTGTGDE